MTKFNAKASRAKRPCPIWVDAFQRDTQHLEVDEIGAYFLILMAMWTRDTCDFPDDDSRLARVSRVSTRLWKSRIGPAIRAFLIVENGAVISKRLREEATYTERQVKQQSDRKVGDKSDNTLKHNGREQSTDITTDEPRNYPTQLPNISSSSSSSARDENSSDQLLSDVMAAVGISGGSIPTYWMPPASTMHVQRWQTDLGLTEAEIIDVAHQSRKRHHDPPGGPKALDRAMQTFAGAKAAPPMNLITPHPSTAQGGRNERSNQGSAVALELAQRIRSGQVKFGAGQSDPFAERG